ncbi:hypothetical protein [Streptomyces buecherae]|uniref:Conjugal transfer protein n=1 Tax=Streptomyces buecherae TaxID=2763006 RepID=A0A7H8NKE8_9ACTN|nr:hypothetical protein [Streptomyces buecherae]QKW55039.1 hypothetical protein HUT08_36530 [Streptomyces buecherae]
MSSEHVPPAPDRALSRGQVHILIAATIPMIAAGALGAWGTYTNIISALDREATALGVVAAGEGATLVLALVMVALTMLGQPSPAAVRVGLWALPAIASGTGAIVAQGATEAVVFAVTPMAMCVSAEGTGLVARRIVIYRTGVDMEAQRRAARVTQKMAVLRAVSVGHPEEKTRTKAEKASWRLARRVGAEDPGLGAPLVAVQRERMVASADAALGSMFAVTPPVTPVTETVTAERGPGTRAPDAITQLNADAASRSGMSVTGTVTAPAPVSVTEQGDASRARHTVTLADVAAVAGVPVPVPGDRLTDPQLAVVLRYLRYDDDPPLSYRQAVAAFREAGFVGGEARIRRTWGHLMSQEEADLA